jgi:hypothetical protein
MRLDRFITLNLVQPFRRVRFKIQGSRFKVLARPPWAHLDTATGLLPLPASGARGEGWGEGHKRGGRRGQERLPGMTASSPRPSPPKEEREIESSVGGSGRMRPFALPAESSCLTS